MIELLSTTKMMLTALTELERKLFAMPISPEIGTEISELGSGRTKTDFKDRVWWRKAMLWPSNDITEIGHSNLRSTWLTNKKVVCENEASAEIPRTEDCAEIDAIYINDVPVRTASIVLIFTVEF
jgi:hypothetical protein